MLNEEIMHAILGDKEGLTLGILKQLLEENLWHQTSPKNQGFCQLQKFQEELVACGKHLGKINYKKEAYEGGGTLLSMLEGIPCCVRTWVLDKLFLTI